VSDSPFATLDAVAMSTDTSTANIDPNTGESTAPAQQPSGGQSRGQAQPQRARVDGFAPWDQRNQVIDTPGESRDMRGMQDRAMQGNSGSELARRVQQQTVEESQQSNGADDRQYQATLVEDDPRVQADPQYAEWKKKAEQWDAIVNGGDLPDEFLTSFRTVKIDGRPVKFSVRDMERERFREADYHRKLHALKQREQYAQNQENGVAQIVQALTSGDPQLFLACMQWLTGAFETFHRAALVHGAQLDALNNMDPMQRQMALQLHQANAQQQRMAVELASARAQAQQQVQQTDPSGDHARFKHQLEQMYPIAKRILEQRGTPFVENSITAKFWRSTWEMFASSYNGELTTADVVDVLASIQQQADEEVRRQPAYEPAAARQLPGVSRAAAGPNMQQNVNQAPRGSGYQNGRQTRARLSDIANINRPQQ